MALALPLTAADWPRPGNAANTTLTATTPARRAEQLQDLVVASPSQAEALVRRALDDPEIVVRAMAAELVGRFRMRALREVVVRWLDDPSPQLRIAAAHALATTGETATISSLIRLFGDRDEAVKLAGIQAIAAIGGPSAVVPLLDRLSDDASEVRIAAARALGELGDRRAVLPLLGAIQDASPDVRDASATALGRLRDERAVRGLVTLLRDSQAEVRLAATRALGALGSETAVVDLAPIALGTDVPGDPAQRLEFVRGAIVSIGRINGTNARSVLVRALRGTRSDLIARAAGEALRNNIGDAASEVIGPLTEEPVPDVAREAVATLLGEIGGDQAADALLNLSDISRTPNAEIYLRALGRTGSSRALRALLRAATARESTQSRQTAFGSIQSAALASRRSQALRGIEAWVARNGQLESEALDPLLVILQEAIRASSTQHNVGARPSISPQSATNNSDVAIVLRLIGRSNNPRAPQNIAPMLASQDRGLRTVAAEALTRVGVHGIEAQAVSLLTDPTPAVRASVGDALAKFGDATVLTALIQLWNGDRPCDRAVAAVALGRIAARLQDRRVTTLLLQTLAQASGDLSTAVIDGLGSIATFDPAAVSALNTLARSDANGSLAAIEALGNALASANATTQTTIAQHLVEILRARPSEFTEAAAVWALGHAPPNSAGLEEIRTLLGSPTNSVAANALGAMTLRVRAGLTLPTELSATLCSVLTQRAAPAVRANTLALIEASHVHCEQPALGRILSSSRHAGVRQNAAAAMATTATAEERESAIDLLLRCVNNDRSVSVSALCQRQLQRLRPASSVAGTRSETALDPLDVLVLSEDEDAAAVRSAYVLWLPNGLARVGLTGPTGWIRERPTLRGDYMVQDPSQLPIDP